MDRALQVDGTLPCPTRAGQVTLPTGQGKVTKTFKGQVMNVITCQPAINFVGH